MNLQDAFNRVDVAADVTHEAHGRFLTPDVYTAPAESVAPAIRTIQELSQRLMLLQLDMRIIIRACSIELDLEVERQTPSIKLDDLPEDASEAADLVTRFATDAEQAFDSLVDILASMIAENGSIFYRCMSDLLENLDPERADHWKMASRTVMRSDMYRHTFLDSRIESPVAVLNLLKDLKEKVPDMAEQLKLDQWIAVALQRLYETAAKMYAGLDRAKKEGRYQERDEELVGQAATKIWKFDPDYKDSRSWFPPDHRWWPFHLPGKPQLLREYSLPPGKVMDVVFLPWGGDTLAVAMRNGELLFFRPEEETPIRQVSTQLEPRNIEYTNYGLMVHGTNAYGDPGPLRQWLVLSDAGQCLQDEVITERTPTQAELNHLEELGRWKRNRELKRLSSCYKVIREGLVPYPPENPGYFTLARIGKLFREKCPRLDTMDARFVFSRDNEESALSPVQFFSSGGLKQASEAGDFLLALDNTRSKLFIESRRLKDDHSFLVPPGVTHFDMAGSHLLALAGPGRLYLYGNRQKT